MDFYEHLMKSIPGLLHSGFSCKKLCSFPKRSLNTNCRKSVHLGFRTLDTSPSTGCFAAAGSVKLSFLTVTWRLGKEEKVCRESPYTYIFLKSAFFSWGCLSQFLRHTVVGTTYPACLLNHPNLQLKAKGAFPSCPTSKVKEMQTDWDICSLRKELFFPYSLWFFFSSQHFFFTLFQ